MQTCLFPIGFVSEAVLMSWSAYLLLAGGERGWRATALKQVALSAVIAAAFGQVSVLAVPANLLLVPAFAVLLGSALALGFWPHLPGATLVLAFHRSFLGIVEDIGDLVEHWPWLAPAPQAVPIAVRLAAAVVAGWLLLNRCRELAISPYVGD
jgi:hypothetical protein